MPRTIIDRRRAGETLEDAARRVAIDALYEARDDGGTMHDAGELAGDRVLDLVGLEPRLTALRAALKTVAEIILKAPAGEASGHIMRASAVIDTALTGEAEDA